MGGFVSLSRSLVQRTSTVNIDVLSDRYERMFSDVVDMQKELKEVRETVMAVSAVLDVIKNNIGSFSDTIKKLNEWKLVEDTLNKLDRQNIDLVSTEQSDLLIEVGKVK